MQKFAIFALGASILATVANAQVVELPESFNRFDISGVKLGDSPDTIIATLTERGFECDFSKMMNSDGTVINSNGHAGTMECETTDHVQSHRGPIHRAEMTLDFGNLDLSGTGTDASKVFATYIKFSENYPDQPNIETMNARLTGKYGELDYNNYNKTWSKTGSSSPDLEERHAAYTDQEKQCDGLPRAERIAKFECSLKEAELHYAYLAGRPANLTARYWIGSNSYYSSIEITAHWTHWDAVRSIRRTAAVTEELLAEAKAAPPEIDENVETTF
ncbi:hypothetical protein HNE_2053 [Hyphomonas neptunium ATCC 15444]|uniref:Lipoprotein n=2 Tax=Hyphomonas TaxID=85 RepID=Q0C0J2_HYPNA|nr:MULTISPECIES: hypothetical protein [Hyphomonas]ABI75649.1 hypothetical protein HNE_2053 [Hyphomonas neptunium ATCC 15444]KCZ87553.1 hypothetical protein HHI_15928 [Hyphomonas hirschiana VP5]